MWDFLDDEIRLAGDFKVEQQDHENPPKGGASFSKLSPGWQEIFKAKNLDVVLVQNAEEEDIEDLFSRLNNGEPLVAAEKRNAMPGAMTQLIREVAAFTNFKGAFGVPQQSIPTFRGCREILADREE